MKTLRGLIFLLPCILFVVPDYAQHTIRVHNGGNVIYSNGTTSTDSSCILFRNEQHDVV